MIDKKLFHSFITEEAEGEWTDDDGNLQPPERWVENRYTDPLRWPVAEEYRVAGNQIQVEKVGDCRVHEYPSEKTDLFLSFMKLGRRGADSDKRLQKWVEGHGLLRRKSPDLHGPFIKTGIGSDVTKEINQAPTSLDHLREEVREAYSAAELYRHLYSEDLPALAEWVRKLGEEQQQNRMLNQVERILLPDGKSPPGPSEALDHRWVLGIVAGFQSFTRDKVSEVRLSMSSSSIWPFPQERYAPQRSYRCPDLLSAIWLQFYLAVTERHPLRRCRNGNCRNLFFPRRRDQWSCSDGCRSSSRPSRQKSTDM